MTRSWNESSFADWMEKINAVLWLDYGLHSLDLPDWDYATAFLKGMQYDVAARKVVKAASSF